MYPYQMKQTQFRSHLESERQEWLAAGMSEADIYRIHFGAENENGHGGDYGAWLSERKHFRADHKYSPGIPVAIDTVDPDSAWISSGKGGLDDVEFQIDCDAALDTLTELQRASFVGVRLDGRTQEDVAHELGVSRESVKQAIGGAVKKLQKYFS